MSAEEPYYAPLCRYGTGYDHVKKSQLLLRQQEIKYNITHTMRPWLTEELEKPIASVEETHERLQNTPADWINEVKEPLSLKMSM